METILLTHVICVKFWIYVLLSNFLNISDNLNYANLQNGFELDCEFTINYFTNCPNLLYFLGFASCSQTQNLIRQKCQKTTENLPTKPKQNSKLRNLSISYQISPHFTEPPLQFQSTNRLLKHDHLSTSL